MSRSETVATCYGPYCPVSGVRRTAADVERFTSIDRAADLLELLARNGPTPLRVLAERAGLSTTEVRAAIHGLEAEDRVRVVGPGASREWRVARLTSAGEEWLRALRN